MDKIVVNGGAIFGLIIKGKDNSKIKINKSIEERLSIFVNGFCGNTTNLDGYVLVTISLKNLEELTSDRIETARKQVMAALE